MKFKCINSEGFPGLTHDKIYEAVDVSDPPTKSGVCIRLDNGKLFFFSTKKRFKKL